MSMLVTEHTVRTDRHTTGYLAAGPDDGPVVIFVHGWPELSLSWRHQLPVFGGLGFRAVAPDMRGYGRSSTYDEASAFSQQEIVTDMVELADHLGAERPVWVGHDWGSPVVWNLASHHPERCHGVVNLCVPYRTLDLSWEATIELVDRDVYPIDQYPAGQWDYQLHYQESPERAAEVFGADSYATVRALFRKGDPSQVGRPTFSATVRADGGWFRGADRAPLVPIDHDVVSEADLRSYAAALDRNGFSGPNAWYLNHEANERYASSATNGGKLDLPVLFLAARFDHICQCVGTRLAEPMRQYCSHLTEHVIDTGHWMAQERPAEVNSAILAWLRAELPGYWPPPAPAGQ